MKVVLISGKARSGKDQSALFIKDYMEKSTHKRVVIVKYGDFLKGFLKNSLGWDGKKDENGRSLLQKFGTDVIRKSYEYAFTDMMIALLKGICKTFDYVLISDVRFPNEADEIKAIFDSITLRITRDKNESLLTKEQLSHQSETAMDNYDFDAYINNNFDLNTLKTACKDFCQTYFFLEG